MAAKALASTSMRLLHRERATISIPLQPAKVLIHEVMDLGAGH